MKEELKYAMATRGELFVMTTGILGMLMLFVASLGIDLQVRSCSCILDLDAV